MSEAMTHVWRLVENWRLSQRFHVTQAALARDIGVARSAVSQWKLGKATPTPEHMRAIQSATGIRYRDLLDALLQDLGYLPPTQESDGHGNAAPTKKPPTTGGVVQMPAQPDPPLDVAADAGPKERAIDDQRPEGEE